MTKQTENKNEYIKATWGDGVLYLQVPLDLIQSEVAFMKAIGIIRQQLNDKLTEELARKKRFEEFQEVEVEIINAVTDLK